MNGKQLFCLSLIILSVAMGMHWFKNRPKKPKKTNDRPRVALNLDDLQLQDEEPDKAGTNKNPNDKDPDNPDDTPPDDQPIDPDNPNNPDNPENPDEPVTANASDSTTIVETASGSENLRPEFNDPIIIALKSMQRDPFEHSPYAKLVEELRAREEAPEIKEEKKLTKLLSANFTATIKTKKELVAVIDSRLYRKGDPFDDNPITDIKSEIVSIDTGSELFLIPKVGVKVTIASDGSYTFQDSFRKN